MFIGPPPSFKDRVSGSLAFGRVSSELRTTLVTAENGSTERVNEFETVAEQV